MKILQLTVHYHPNTGGVETHLTDLVDGLVSKSHQVFVLTYRPISSKVTWKLWEKSKNKSILRVPWFPGFFYSLVNRPALEFIYLAIGLLLVTPWVLVLYNPKVIHAHGLIAGFVAVAWGKIFNKKVILSTHNIYDFPESGPYRQMAKFVFSSASKVLCLSNQSVEEIINLGVNRDRVDRFTYWIDTQVFKPMDKSASKKKLKWEIKPTVLFVGRLVAIKGISELLQASLLMGKKYAIKIVGDGPLADMVKKYAKNEKVDVTYLGKIANTDLPLYYNAADLLIIPSTHEEGFGRVILESLSCGTPVIGSKRGAIPEAMDDSVGKLITVSAKNISSAVESLATNAKLSAYSAKARGFALEKYGSKNIEQILRWY